VTVESPLRREAHGWFGERPGETDPWQHRHRAPGRLSFLSFCDNTDEALAGVLRPGRAGSNTAADHIAVLDAALAQIPSAHWDSRTLVRCDGAGGHPLVSLRHGAVLGNPEVAKVGVQPGVDDERAAARRDPGAARACVDPDAHRQQRRARRC